MLIDKNDRPNSIWTAEYREDHNSKSPASRSSFIFTSQAYVAFDALPAIDDDVPIARFLDNPAAASRAFAADLYGTHSIFRFDPQAERRADDDADIWFGPRFDNTAAARRAA